MIDTADPLRHGYGADALAFRFNRNGVLIAPPAYIAQESPNDFYTRRIGSLTLFRATVHDVEAIFARAHTFAARPDGFMWYYALEIIIRLRTTAAITIDLASLTLPPLTFLIRI